MLREIQVAVYDLNSAHKEVVAGFVADSCRELQHSCQRIAHCLDQLTEADVWWRPHSSMNAIGNLILHLCGNLGQWILSGLGGQPDTRDREREFTHREPLPKRFLLEKLRAVVAECQSVIERQDAASLLRQRPIQHWHTTGLTAVLHVVAHFEGHTQEIVCLTRQLLGDRYVFQWLPPARR